MHLPLVKATVVALGALTAPICSPITCETAVSPVAPVTAVLGLADDLFDGLTAPILVPLGIEDGPAVSPYRRKRR